MYLRTTPCRRASGSPGKLPAKITSALKALASRLTAAFARSVSLHTWAAVKATKSPKMMPSGGNMAGETALNARPHSPTARRATKVWIIPATRYVRPKTRRAIHPMGRLWTQSLMLAPDKRGRLISQQNPSGRPAQAGLSQTVLLQSSVFGGGVQKRVQGFQGLTDAHKLEKLTLQQNRLTRMSRRCRLAPTAC